MELKRENGDSYKIVVRLTQQHVAQFKVAYEVEVYHKAKRKKKWVNVHSTDDYSWRRLDNPGRAAYKLATQLLHVTDFEIYAAKLACWETIKPEPTTI